MKDTEVKQVVRKGYARVAKQQSSCCGTVSACGGSSPPETLSKKIGYSNEEMKSVPDGANLGLGCGNPTALASIKAGETVLDLGSGGGFDCFLAANLVGPQGKVIGIDMTPEMLDRARENLRKGNYSNVEFRLGEIENLPVADGIIDLIISNCVINLAPDKGRVFQEAFRVLKPGGRLMISDIVLLKELPDFIKGSIEAYIGCVAGAEKKEVYLDAIRKAGFEHVKVVGETSFQFESLANDPTMKGLIDSLNIPAEMLKELMNLAVSIKVSATKG